MPFLMAKDTSLAVGPGAELVKNRSLFADKFPEFADQQDDKTARSRTIRRLVESDFEEGPACSARLAALAAHPDACAFAARLSARMIVNHARGVIENAGLALDRNSGVPFIPGSTVKGIARAGASGAGARPEDIAFVFGWAPNRPQESDLPPTLPEKAFAGTVAFLPAYPTGRAPLERDILTAHHHEYYRAERSHPMAYDNEKPIPNEFPVVRAGVEFQFVLLPVRRAETDSVRLALEVGADFKPLEIAKEWLIAGITEHGVGAKTAAGYGWFEKFAAKPVPPQAPASDYTEVSFRNCVLRLVSRRGEWPNLKAEWTTLQKSVNAQWLEKFKAAISGKEHKELRRYLGMQ